MKIIDKSLDMTYSIFPTLYNNREKSRTFHFSYLYKRSKLIGLGYNDYSLKAEVLNLANKFHINSRRKFPSLHSEWAAISRVWGRYHIDNSIKLVNIRINKFGLLQNSKPCESCQQLLDAIGIRKIWYSTKEGEVICESN